MPLFGRQRARDDVMVTPRRRGWALFSRQDRSTYPNNNNTTLRQGRNRDAIRGSKRSRRIGRADARGAQVPLVTRIKRTLGIRTTPRRSGILGRTDAAGPSPGLFSGGASTSRRRGRRGGVNGTNRGRFF